MDIVSGRLYSCSWAILQVFKAKHQHFETICETDKELMDDWSHIIWHLTAECTHFSVLAIFNGNLLNNTLVKEERGGSVD